MPGGVANLRTGRTAELAPWLATHAEVHGLDLAGAPAGLAVELERVVADAVKRVLPRPATERTGPGTPTSPGSPWCGIQTV